MVSARLLVGSAALLAVARPVSAMLAGARPVSAMLAGARPVSAMSVWHSRALQEDEPPEWFGDLSEACRANVETLFGGDGSDSDFSDFSDSDPSSSSDYIEDMMEECNYSAQIGATVETFDYCDGEGDIDGFGTECEDVVELLEFWDCLTYRSSEAAVGLLFNVSALYACDATEQGILEDGLVEEVGRGIHPVTAELSACQGPGRHPCIAPGGPVDLETILPLVEDMGPSGPLSDDGSDDGSDTDGAGLAIALAWISLSAAALLA